MCVVFCVFVCVVYLCFRLLAGLCLDTVSRKAEQDKIKSSVLSIFKISFLRV